VDDAEREVAVELGRRRRQHGEAALGGGRPGGAQQRRLADPGLALDEDERALAQLGRGDPHGQLGELRLALEERGGRERAGHGGGPPVGNRVPGE